MEIITENYIGVKENREEINVKSILIEQGIGVLINGGIFLGITVLGVVVLALTKKIEKLGENLKDSNKHTRIKDEDIETVNNILYGLLHEYDAIRVFILEFHNGTTTANGFSYEKVSMTYEVNALGYIKTARNVQNIPRSIIIEDLIRIRDEGLVELRENSSTNPLLEYGNEIVLLKAIDSRDLNKGCIGISFHAKGFIPIDVKELERSVNKIRQVLR